MERIEEAFIEEFGEDSRGFNPSFKQGYRRGYLSGQRDAWQLPEVTAEELEGGECYLVRYHGSPDWVFLRVFVPERIHKSGAKFIGPLPMPEVKSG